jgi:hypothetical protein
VPLYFCKKSRREACSSLRLFAALRFALRLEQAAPPQRRQAPFRQARNFENHARFLPSFY